MYKVHCHRNTLSIERVGLRMRSKGQSIELISGRSMEGWSGTPEASHSRVNEAEGDPAPDVASTRCYCTVGHISVI